MTPHSLNCYFIGIEVAKSDYPKIEGLLPTPSYQNTLTSHTGHSIVLAYVIEGYITSAKQFKQISDIKLAMREHIIVRYCDVEEFYLSERTIGDGIPYSLQELRKAFRATYRAYPKIYYPPDKKSLYRYLILHGKKLRFEECFTLEALTSSALMMNRALKDPFSIKELHKKTKGAYYFILEHLEKFPKRLEGKDLKAALRKGGQIRKANQASDTQKRITEAIATGDYTKPNGKVNVSKLCSALGINRSTLWRHLKK